MLEAALPVRQIVASSSIPLSLSRSVYGSSRSLQNHRHLVAHTLSIRLSGRQAISTSCRKVALAHNHVLRRPQPRHDQYRTVTTLSISPGDLAARVKASQSKNDDTPSEGKDPKEKENEKEIEGEKPSATRPANHVASSTSGGSGSTAGSSSGDNSDNSDKGDSPKMDVQKPSVPEVYPQVLALPITRRPLFPGFYKAVVIKNPAVVSAIKTLMKRGQPYIGAFLLKDEEADSDVITDLDHVHRVGVFAQITSVFPANNQEESGLTAVLYPHRRIRITDLVRPRSESRPEHATESIAVTEEVFEEPTSTSTSTSTSAESTADTTEGSPSSSSDEQTQYATSFLMDQNVSLVNVENLKDLPHNKKNAVIRAITSEIVSVFKEIAALNPLFRDQIANFSMQQSAGNVFEEPAKLADFAAAVSSAEVGELQDVLESLSVEERLQKSLVVLKKELMNAQLQSKISKDVESKIQKRQREYYLMEQLKGIKRELGIESDGKDKLVENFREKAAKLAMPEGVKKVFDEEINKLAHLEPAASEFNVTRNYLDWLTQIPWGHRSTENYDINHAMKVLDEDHHGLKDVKERILEFIAVGKLRGSVEGKILCFVGPPGVGKTSIGKSIARALNRQFFRFSVGGLYDVAEIKGHRRTYVGAMPGKVVQALKKVQSENPLIMIDEIDKIGRTGIQGDPSSAMLELLDPEQNFSFLDHYMDVPIDLSRVLFVCTANVLDTIPGPLLDRMEVIHLSGYVADEKIAIASHYLAPQAKDMSGLKDANVNLQDSAIEALIKYYCRESGVRNLKKHIDKVYRKAAFKIVKDLGEDAIPEEEAISPEAAQTAKKESDAAKSDATPSLSSDASDKPSDGEEVKPHTTTEQRKPLQVPESVHVDITADNLKEYVGPPIFHSDRLYEKTPPGVVMGLAWTAMGGSALYIESVIKSALSADSTASLDKTGQLGDVMKESSTIAYTFAKSLMVREFPENRFFDKAAVHLHCPEGAVSKDGPSAGITMATALLSLALDVAIPSSVAMTGELTLTGKVLKIGGLREKTVAAKRSGVTTIIFPDANTSDWEELPENIKEGIQGRPVGWYSEVFELVFPTIDRAKAGSRWKADLSKKLNDWNTEKEPELIGR